MWISVRGPYSAYHTLQGVFSFNSPEALCLVTSCLRNEAIQASRILSCLFRLCLWSFAVCYSFELPLRDPAHQWPGNTGILTRDSLCLAVWISASLGRPLKGLNGLFIWRLDNYWPGAFCSGVSPMPYLFHSAPSC